MRISKSSREAATLGFCLGGLLFVLLAAIFVGAEFVNELDDYGNEIKSMKNSGINVERIEELLLEAQNAYSNNETNKTSLLLAQIEALKEKTVELNSRLNKEKDVIAFLKSSNTSTELSQTEYSKAVSEFTLGNLIGTEEHLNSAISENKIIFAKKYDYLFGEVDESDFAEFGIKKEVLNQKMGALRVAIADRDFTKIALLEIEMLATKDTLSKLGESKKKMDSMGDKNIQRFSDLFNEAKLRIEINQLDEAERFSSMLNELFEKEERMRGSIAAFEGKISEYRAEGINTSIAEDSLVTVKREYEVNNYEKAEKILEENILLLEKEKENYLLSNSLETKKRMTFGEFVRKYFWIAAITIAMLSSAYLLFYKRIKRSHYARIVEKYKRERQALVELIKEAQQDYYNKKIMSKDEYEQRIDELEEKLAYINGKLPLFESRMNEHE
ncbi:hypothetical protein JXA85_04620 [Candidatus Woesearchaeota archaeon]|nr:hypothetical protein [Candidatus Woesearchaeota archaeon]